MFILTQTNGSRTYLLIVVNVRVDGKVKQRGLHRLGRLDDLLASGQVDALLQSLGRFSEKLTISAPTHEVTASPLAAPGSGRP